MEILVNEKGERRVADFPVGVVQAAQYGEGMKAHAVYMSVQQLIPCNRVSEYFTSQTQIPLSAGSARNFKEEAYKKLEWFEGWVKERLKGEGVLNVDETGINIGGKRVWPRNSSSPRYTPVCAA